MNDEIKNMLMEASQGNPGFINVTMMLREIGKPIDAMLLKFLMTNSRASDLWRVFKDVHGNDLEKTWDTIVDWILSPLGSREANSLGEYIKVKGLGNKRDD